MQGHWDDVYGAKAADELSWFQATPAVSLRLLGRFAPPPSSVIDVGGGASTLVDVLLDEGWADVTVLDVSATALEAVRARLGDRHEHRPLLVHADLLGWDPPRQYDVWHDRAVFHFLVEPTDRRRYVDIAARAVRPGGHLVVATFAPDGPAQCSGLPTARYDAEALAREFASGFDSQPCHAEREEHCTPSGVVQPFTWVVLRRR
jgi:SAM-dependent methyltransferase